MDEQEYLIRVTYRSGSSQEFHHLAEEAMMTGVNAFMNDLLITGEGIVRLTVEIDPPNFDRTDPILREQLQAALRRSKALEVRFEAQLDRFEREEQHDGLRGGTGKQTGPDPRGTSEVESNGDQA